MVVTGCKAQQAACDISVKVYEGFFKGKYEKVFIADKFSEYRIKNFDEFKIKYHGILEADELQSLYKESLVQKKKDSLHSCFVDSLAVSGKEIVRLFEEYAISPIIDSALEDSINKRINTILSMTDEDEKYKIYNEFMRTKEVVELLEQKNYKHPRILFLGRPVISGKIAMMHVEVNPPRRIYYSFMAFYRNKNGRWELVKSVPD